MKARCVLLAAALALLLTGCQGEKTVETVSTSPDTPASMEEPVPPEATPPTRRTPEELLAEQLIDDGHDAFLVDTGGRMGTLLVTVEKGEEEPKDSWEYLLYFSVWNPEDMSQPIQNLEGTGWSGDLVHGVLDANFDGHMDFSYLSSGGNGAAYFYLWVWGEEAGQFVEVPEYREISWPRCNPETEVIDGWERYSGGGDGLTTFHRWEDGELVCIRRIETGYDVENRVEINETSYFPSWIRVEDRIDGKLTEVYYQYYVPNGETGGFFPEREKWGNLDYHGED